MTCCEHGIKRGSSVKWIDISHKLYTIDGTKRLSKASTDEINVLPKGVYIVNGKKIIIK